jgi:hypothetical protein
MNDTINIFDLFNRLKQRLEIMHSRFKIRIFKHTDDMNERIQVLYPGNTKWSTWYLDVDIDTNLQLFFLGNAINNRDALIDSGIILPIYMSVFKLISDLNLDDQAINAIFKPIGIPSSLEELSIKFDLLGI